MRKNQQKHHIKASVVITLGLGVIVGLLAILGILMWRREDSDGQKVQFITGNDDLYDIAIQYLIDHDERNYRKEDGYKLFTYYTGFGIAEDELFKYAYMWILEESFYVMKSSFGTQYDRVVRGSGSHMPYKFVFDKDSHKIVDYEIPDSGSYYPGSIRRMFPREIVDEIIHYNTRKAVEAMDKEVQEYYSWFDFSDN